jgi:class 3 adenylate cyclase
VELLDDDIRGIEVHATARIMAAAPPGGVFASAVSRALASASRLRFTSAASHSLKGFDQVVELYDVEDRR